MARNKSTQVKNRCNLYLNIFNPWLVKSSDVELTGIEASEMASGLLNYVVLVSAF